MEFNSDKLQYRSVTDGQRRLIGIGYREQEYCKLENLKPPRTLTDLIEGFHTIFAYRKVYAELVMLYMSMYTSNYNEWKKYAIPDKHKWVPVYCYIYKTSQLFLN